MLTIRFDADAFAALTRLGEQERAEAHAAITRLAAEADLRERGSQRVGPLRLTFSVDPAERALVIEAVELLD